MFLPEHERPNFRPVTYNMQIYSSVLFWDCWYKNETWVHVYFTSLSLSCSHTQYMCTSHHSLSPVPIHSACVLHITLSLLFPYTVHVYFTSLSLSPVPIHSACVLHITLSLSCSHIQCMCTSHHTLSLLFPYIVHVYFTSLTLSLSLSCSHTQCTSCCICAANTVTQSGHNFSLGLIPLRSATFPWVEVAGGFLKYYSITSTFKMNRIHHFDVFVLFGLRRGGGKKGRDCTVRLSDR